ncbi:hypothetical protein RHGRI_033522 [Rhododendron griersonianum]|uniref:Maturase K n=1 Tax=Rhododendron griersonianum TaxID=479676 RepID=A0AAV6I089_9ERIC|nr:hypothetical protein RHGRI_033522 [Rhododendron griersonianum]
MPGFFSPYRGERYHLNNFCGHGRRPKKIEEWFNFRLYIMLSSDVFGVLKARFPILKQIKCHRIVFEYKSIFPQLVVRFTIGL